MWLAAACVLGPFAVTPLPASAENLFDFFFGGNKQQRQEAPPQASAFADPTNGPQPPVPLRGAAGGSGSGPSFCVRSFTVMLEGNSGTGSLSCFDSG